MAPTHASEARTGTPNAIIAWSEHANRRWQGRGKQVVLLGEYTSQNLQYASPNRRNIYPGGRGGRSESGGLPGCKAGAGGEEGAEEAGRGERVWG